MHTASCAAVAMRPAAISIDRAADEASVSVRTIYRAIARGDLPASKIGRRTVVLVTSFDVWLAGCPPVSAGDVR